ncbi:putative UDP-N-acetylglucosamine transferase subunit ALG13 [Clavispora lusitaniae]|uniref:UDP-N-acetylglucosamine transferase subunit ALG13 n=1 Tax=Clavispora lusitaniae TaxID=36911 RepID=A0ACD0WGA3_CLALS|nr:putative UDP-N-acetylglucosamine transferase subunit ALG13 [Clavispora lusitaniae]QFZ31934.1 putative UDP-N-acetylglucosamine transferase subunit ALG13 [Clavispora lusitaniae]QFZ37603.1 putative UDP-N-acetylglucosamine transferase subunit ALG13 [Clavispora lusitaniae]QFZ43287.1 putative UDP-N-acetylglucosamine transferase subunit ALG13 [Clavispora lusitaniae]QFZ48963.1 putative UDP-N-acetylglucosamine transferase subunit ALG13 [Clavispora lusitaniae]
MSSILVTTGATVTFKPLVSYIADLDFLLEAQKLGYSTIYLQYGNEISNNTNVSKDFLNEVMQKSQLIEKLGLGIVNETNDKSVTHFSNGRLSLVVFAFSSHISDYISKVDIVVSHAGTGSILDSLRLKKPLLVVSNSELMGNHQEEVAAQFEKEGFLHHITTKQLQEGYLLDYLRKFSRGTLPFSSLPDPPTGVVESILAEELAR